MKINGKEKKIWKNLKIQLMKDFNKELKKWLIFKIKKYNKNKKINGQDNNQLVVLKLKN